MNKITERAVKEAFREGFIAGQGNALNLKRIATYEELSKKWENSEAKHYIEYIKTEENKENRHDNRNIHEIIYKYLTTNGFDGLVDDDGECACGIKDLCPDGNPQWGCLPGYEHKTPFSPNGNECWISPNKTLSKEEQIELGVIE